MSYEKLKGYMARFRLGEISKLEMACIIALWQRSGARVK